MSDLDWRPAPDQHCCGTCTHLREEPATDDVPEGLLCVQGPVDGWRDVGSRWWGNACAQWAARSPRSGEEDGR